MSIKNIQKIINYILNIGADSIDARIYSGDWMLYLGERELQNRGLETYACASFSFATSIEAIFNFLIATNSMPADDVQWLADNGYLINGMVNFSDRFLAEASGTYKGGNSLSNVADAADQVGLVPELLYPYPENPSWDEYYKSLDEKLHQLGREFLERFDLQWTWAHKDDFDKKILKSPIQVIMYGFARNNDGLYYKPKNKNFNHAVVKYKKENFIFDSYKPFFKELTDDNFYDYGIIVDVISKYSMDIQNYLIKNDLKWVQNKDTGALGRILRGALYVVQSKDRDVLMLVDDKVRENGMHISAEIWDKLPQQKF